MSPYITFRDTDAEGELQYYILQRAYPNYVFLISNHPVESLIQSIQIPGYYMWVVFSGTLMGNFIPGYKNIIDELYHEMNQISIWYYENRILTNPKKYKNLSYDRSS